MECFVYGDDKKYKEYVSQFLLEYAAAKCFPHFDFMGAGSPNKHYGVREFKEKSGGELVE